MLARKAGGKGEERRCLGRIFRIEVSFDLTTRCKQIKNHGLGETAPARGFPLKRWRRKPVVQNPIRWVMPSG